MEEYPKLETLPARIKALPDTPFEYYKGHRTETKYAHFPKPREWAMLAYLILKNNAGDKKFLTLYLELIELIEKYENDCQ